MQTRIDAEAELVDDGKSAFALWVVRSPLFQPDDMGALSKDFGEALSVRCRAWPIPSSTITTSRARRCAASRMRARRAAFRVIGEPEAWEAKALFSAVRLAELSEELEEDLEGELLAREKAELERLWLAGKLVEGSTRPPADPA